MIPRNAMPSIGVVVATDRGGPFLDEALRSIEAQSVAPAAVVLVDDGSGPEAGVAACVARHPGVDLIRISHRGVSAARNAGVARLATDHVAFLDDDDRWLPDRLRAHLDAIRGAPSSIGSITAMRLIDARGQVLTPAEPLGPVGTVDLMRGDVPLMTGGLVVRRDAFWAAGGFDPLVTHAEDLDLVYRLTALGDFVAVQGSHVDYRTHGANMSGNHRAIASGVRRVVDDNLRRARRAHRSELVRALRRHRRTNDRYAAWGAARSARRHLAAGEPGRALGELLWAEAFAPLVGVNWCVEHIRRRRTGEHG